MKFIRTLILILIISWLVKKLVRRLSVKTSKRRWEYLRLLATTAIAYRLLNNDK